MTRGSRHRESARPPLQAAKRADSPPESAVLSVKRGGSAPQNENEHEPENESENNDRSRRRADLSRHPGGSGGERAGRCRARAARRAPVRQPAGCQTPRREEVKRAVEG